ncbi:cell division protein FtsQ/DivIB [Shouchella shacheensis]|uniref:cell division protein FtsQ/DivIB n=1 Tax=Shouchella shacheensis TaxID=1649580 RepID=UPI00074026D0|nr:FtsQ-type POTRA domain-containing protein [Shouchella shacheensis]
MNDEKVVSMSERIPTIKEERKRRANRRLIFFLTLFFFLLVAIIYFQSPLSDISSVQVVGNAIATEEKVIEASGLSEGMNIWNLAAEEREQTIEGMKEIQSASISRAFPNNVVVTVEEYPRVAYAYNDGAYSPILQNGEELEPIPNDQLSGDAPILVGMDDSEVIAQLGDELTQTSAEIINRISEIVYAPTEEDSLQVTLYMNDGIEVRTSIDSFAANMEPYPAVALQIDPDRNGVLHMKMSPYFEDYDYEEQDS